MPTPNVQIGDKLRGRDWLGRPAEFNVGSVTTWPRDGSIHIQAESGENLAYENGAWIGTGDFGAPVDMDEFNRLLPD